MAERETLAIDREIVSLTGKDRPNALFIPTASGDSPEYWQSFPHISHINSARCIVNSNIDTRYSRIAEHSGYHEC